MAEAALKRDATDMPFPHRVWYVLSSIDVSDRTEKKGRFDYLPWADAWEMLMQHYPESTYDFAEPKFWENGTGEQWVTVTVKEGDNQFSRSWWLPFLDHQNKPLTNPTSLQINNTRMRVLVKCIAMMGLGIHVFSGEDVPTEDADQKPVTSTKRTGVRAAVMEDINLTDEQWATVREWADRLKEVMPDKDGIDWGTLAKVYLDLRGLDSDVKVVLYDRLESWQRNSLKKLQREHDEKARQEAVDQIKDQ